MKRLSSRNYTGGAVELLFMARAAALGLRVSMPLDHHGPYDAIVEGANGNLYKVQVKSASSEYSYGQFNFRTMRETRELRPYNSTEFDFLVAYVVPADTWYVIPFKAIEGIRGVAVHPRRRIGKYEIYREAWDLLTGESSVAGRQWLVASGQKSLPTN